MKRLKQERLISYFLLPFLSTLIFLLGLSPSFQNWIKKEIPDFSYRIFVLAIGFFTLIYILNRLIQKYLRKKSSQKNSQKIIH